MVIVPIFLLLINSSFVTRRIESVLPPPFCPLPFSLPGLHPHLFRPLCFHLSKELHTRQAADLYPKLFSIHHTSNQILSHLPLLLFVSLYSVQLSDNLPFPIEVCPTNTTLSAPGACNRVVHWRVLVRSYSRT